MFLITRYRYELEPRTSLYFLILGLAGDAYGRYERDEVKPTIEMANRIANALSISLDYLVGNTDTELDTETLKRVEDISKLDTEDKKSVYILLDALIRDFKAKKAYS
jgi:transcriptional regulator with XRE-family HTH domain